MNVSSISISTNIPTLQLVKFVKILRKERRGGNTLGATVRVIPHITDALKEKKSSVPL